jgi:hypothetical protein
VKKWVAQCLDEHPSCSKDPSALPTRVISVGNSEHDTHLLISNELYGHWVVLSHCWGNKREGITTSRNIAEREQRLEVDKLPVLFQDAIYITRRLGYKFIWIDSLCILQDSEADWRTESLKMAQYYGGSILNISASAAPDASTGIFESGDLNRENKVPAIRLECHSKVNDIRGSIYVRHSKQPERDPTNWEAPLIRRAWVFQESILSPRVLSYDENHLRWECKKVRCIEEIPEWPRSEDLLMKTPERVKIYALPPITDGRCDFKHVLELDPSLRRFAWTWWYHVLNEYLHRDITFPNDRLPAIAGVAKEFAKRTGCTYVCGLWKEDLLNGLRWTPVAARDSKNGIKGPPTWSWASTSLQQGDPCWQKGLPYYACGYECRLGYDTAEVVNCAVVNENEDGYGQVISASLKLKGRWLYTNSMLARNSAPVRFVDTQKLGYNFGSISDDKMNNLSWGRRTIVCALDELPGPQGYEPEELGANTIYFQLGVWGRSEKEDVRHGRLSALILKPVDGNESTYERIGLAVIMNHSEAQGWPIRTVTII